VRNLAELIVDRCERRPDARFGLAEHPITLSDAVASASRAVGALAGTDIGPGSRVAMIGETSTSYLVTWMAFVLAGAEPALVNPTYPAELLDEMLDELDPAAVVWLDRPPEPKVARGVSHLDSSQLHEGHLLIDGEQRTLSAARELPGLARRPLDVAGYMHTSGTTGVPKFCVQSHEYFLRLGRFVADSMCFSPRDTVFAPLPMFHVNPLGYGVVGGLVGGADVLGTRQFSAHGFWPLVREVGATALVLHAPPVEILKRATTAADAAGHRVERVFFADGEFLERFGIPLAFSAYGSTEAGGLSHIWAWRAGDRPDLPEGMSRYGGRARHELRWHVGDDGQIAIRSDRPGVLFTGYRTRDGAVEPCDDSGWFHTGDLGRVDSAGNLVFIERRAESIRVKGEYVPIGYVEQRFGQVEGVDDVAVWRRKSELVDDEVVLYVVADPVPLDGIRDVADDLPPFMRPACVARVSSIPRDTGIGKVRRRLLDIEAAVEVLAL
jgi:crotonobetaine/carnitine-CoA ligase